MSSALTKGQAGSISSPFLMKFLGKMGTVSKDGSLGINSRKPADYLNKNSKTSIVRHNDENYLSVPKESTHKSAIKPVKNLKPIKYSCLNTPSRNHNEQKST